jgi:predicted Rossmann fold flavoprotein
VTGIRREENHLIVDTEHGAFPSQRVIIASGGQSIPKMGTVGAGYAWARELGHRIVPPTPALVPLLGGTSGEHELRGVSCDGTIRVRDAEGRTLSDYPGPILFTHIGWSGPAVLDASRWAIPGKGNTFSVQWLGHGVDHWREQIGQWYQERGARSCRALLREILPLGLTDCILTQCDITKGGRVADLPKEKRRRLVELLGNYPLGWSGTAGFEKAEVTAGGVALTDVHTATMESRVVPGLYFCGEILDVTGRLGGFNFAWAWITGRIAGSAAGAAAAGG